MPYRDIILKTVYLTTDIKLLEKVYVTLGTVVSIENAFIFHVIRNKTQSSAFTLHWSHTVNKSNFTAMCINPVARLVPIHHRIKYKSPSCVITDKTFKCNFSMNICEKAFGLHQFALIKTDKRGRNETIYHPRQLLLLPAGTIISQQLHYDVYDQMPIRFFDDQNLIFHESVLKLIQTKEILEFRKYELLMLVFRIALGIIFSLSLSGMDLICSMMSFYVFDYLDGDAHRLGMAPRKIKRRHKHIKYDFFISFCENDRDFAIQIVVALLENQLGLKVCLPDRDIRPGHTLWTEYGKCISLSKRIIVVLSDNYLHDPLCNQMQFSMIIVPMLCNRDKSAHEIFLLNYRPCKVPSFYYEFLTVSHWYEYRCVETLRNVIQDWIEKSEPSMLNIFSEILFKSLVNCYK